MTENNTQRMFFFALLFLITVAFLWLVRSFLQPIFWAVALGIIVYPAHARLVPLLKNRASLAAGVSVLIVVVVVILPLIGIGAAVTSEARAFFCGLVDAEVCRDPTAEAAAAADGAAPPVTAPPAETAAPRRTPAERIEDIFAWLRERPVIGDALEGFNVEQLRSQVQAAVGTASQFIAVNALAIGQNTVRIALYFFLMLYLLFFFLRDGTRLLEGLVQALPLGDARERALLERFAVVARATIKGTLVVGTVQGTIGGIAFATLGIGAPVLWGVVMALLSILPAVGPAVVWLPAAIILFVDDRWIAGIVLVLIGVLVIGLVDNLLRPILVGRDTRMPDYLVLLATLGGLAGFGLAGIVIGPIIAAFFLSVWQMAQEEFSRDEARG